jgi:uncharacterized protein YggT (Ycf19 family)
MSLLDLILNIACVLLWLNWRSVKLDPFLDRRPVTLAGTLRRAEPPKLRGWYFLIALIALLFGRAVLYWQLGSAVNWTPRLQLISITVSFRSDFPSRMYLFSFLSFALTLGIFYLWLLFLSLVNGKQPEPDPVQRLLGAQLGPAERWPWLVKLVLPLLLSALLWLSFNPLLARLDLVPRPPSKIARFEQAAIIGLGGYLTWKYLIIAFLGLYVLSSYVYLGPHPWWNFVALTGRRLLAPLRWMPLQVGKVDFAPVVAIALVFFLAELGERGLTALYRWVVA